MRLACGAIASVLCLIQWAKAEEEQLTEAEQGLRMLTCSSVMRKRWSSDIEGIQQLVNETMEEFKPPIPEGHDMDLPIPGSLNFTEAAKILAKRQLAACLGNIHTNHTVKSKQPGGLDEEEIDEILSGANSTANLTEENSVLYDKALKGELVNDEAPALLGLQVHKIPRSLQILYMLLVLGALIFVVMKAVNRLTKEKPEKLDKKEKKALKQQ